MLLSSAVFHELCLDGITILPELSNVFHNRFQISTPKIEWKMSETFTVETFQVSPFLYKAVSCKRKYVKFKDK